MPPQPGISGFQGDPPLLVLGAPMEYDPCKGGQEGEGRRRARVTALITSGCGGGGGGVAVVCEQTWPPTPPAKIKPGSKNAI
jgi:hypothetical protein